MSNEENLNILQERARYYGTVNQNNNLNNQNYNFNNQNQVFQNQGKNDEDSSKSSPLVPNS